MSEEDKKKKPKLRGWVGRKAGAEDVSGSAENKITAALKKEDEE
ncbi:MAG: hypothetical protein ACTSQI_08925 [Candidatus Helarchaeota archaeon]